MRELFRTRCDYPLDREIDDYNMLALSVGASYAVIGLLALYEICEHILCFVSVTSLVCYYIINVIVTYLGQPIVCENSKWTT